MTVKWWNDGASNVLLGDGLSQQHYLYTVSVWNISKKMNQRCNTHFLSTKWSEQTVVPFHKRKLSNYATRSDFTSNIWKSSISSNQNQKHKNNAKFTVRTMQSLTLCKWYILCSQQFTVDILDEIQANRKWTEMQANGRRTRILCLS